MARAWTQAELALLPSFLSDLDPSIYLSDNYIVLDFEVDTTHGDYGSPVHSDNKMLLGHWRVGKGHKLYGGDKAGGTVWGDEYSAEWDALRDALSSARFLVAHNAQYELGWLRRMGVDLRSVLPFDTQIAEYVLLGNLAAGAKELGMLPVSISLDACAARRGLPRKDPVVDVLIGNGINPLLIPKPWLGARNQLDVETTELLFLRQREELQRSGRLPVQYTRCLLTPVLADVQFEGMALDGDRVQAAFEEYTAKQETLQAQMDLLTGGINMNSPKQKAEFIYGKLGFKELTNRRGEPKRAPGGGRLTNDKALQQLKVTTLEQTRFIELRSALSKVSAALSKNLLFFKGVVDEYGGQFFAQIHQTRTATHRLSSTGIPLVFKSLLTAEGKPSTRSVQFQNTPRDFKKLFKAKRPGFLIVDPDGSGLEMRAAIQLGDDRQGIIDIDSNHDFHTFTASVLNGIGLTEVTTEGANSQRQLAKPDTFKPLYGGTKGTAAQERYYAAFRARYPDIDETQQAWLAEVLRTKQLVTPWGLIYYFPTAKVNKNGWSNVTSTVYNYPVQTFATAEIVPIALVYLWHGIRERGLEQDVFIVNTVHDDAPCEVRANKVEAFIDLAKQAFTTDVYRYLEKVYKIQMKVALGVGIKAGEHWGEGKEQQFNIYPDGREVKIK